MGSVINAAVQWAVGIAEDNSHGYDQGSRWGPNYDCSALVISAYENAGAGVKKAGATTTSNMYSIFLNCGFSDVTSSINLSAGSGTKKGDVLLKPGSHTAMVIEDGGRIVHASINENGKVTGGKSGDQTGKEICVRSYYNKPWTYVLRYNESDYDLESISVEYEEYDDYDANSDYSYSDPDYSEPILPDSSGSEESETEKPRTFFSAFATGDTVGTRWREYIADTTAQHALYVDGVDITDQIGSLTWSNSTEELATTLTFSSAKTDMQHMHLHSPELGNVVSLFFDKEIFRGIIVTMDDGDPYSNKYTAVDFGWYLNKSKETYQFQWMPGEDVIRKICTDFGIPVDIIPALGVAVDQIYIDKTIDEIIKDILNQCPTVYVRYVTPKGLRIVELGCELATPQFRISPNTQYLSSEQFHGSVTRSQSIEEMKNSVKIVTDEDNACTVQKVLQAEDDIYLYGMLQEVVTVDPAKESVDQVAHDTLHKLNRITENLSCQIIEHDSSYIRAGMRMPVDGVEYLVKSSNHSIVNGRHFVSLELVRWTSDLLINTGGD